MELFYTSQLDEMCLLLLLKCNIHIARGYHHMHRVGYWLRFRVLFKFNDTHVPLISGDGYTVAMNKPINRVVTST